MVDSKVDGEDFKGFGPVLNELIRARRTLQVFTPAPNDPELIERALELALWAPNHRLTFPWRFVVVEDSTRQRLADLALELKRAESSQKLSKAQELAIRNKILEPAALVGLGCLKNADPLVERENYASVACGVQNISLYLWSQGWGSKWGTGALTRQPQVYELFNWNPDQVEIVGFLWAGPYDRSPRVPERPSLDQFLARV